MKDEKIEKIEKAVLALSGMMLSYMASCGENNSRIETYIRMVVTKQTHMQQNIELILACLKIRHPLATEDALEDYLKNYGKEGNK